jgi:hypothetical protein
MSVFVFYFATDYPSIDLFFKLKKINRISLFFFSLEPLAYVVLAADFDTPASIAIMEY